VTVEFFRPDRAYDAQREELNAAFETVLGSRRVVLGPEVEQFEAEFAEIAGTRHAVGVASGTDALELALRALELRPGSEVLCPNLTAVATAAAVVRAGLTPVFVEVEPETLTLSVEQAAAALTAETAAIVAVHLYGRPAPVAALTELGLPVVEDCAHAHGLQVDGRPAGSVGRLGSFSFYPTKNLGAFGDGGAVTTSDPELAERVRSLRAYGAGADGRVTRPGLNSRLDELQAALLRVRLRRLRQDNERRAEIARTYDAALGRASPPGVHHLYVARSPRRDEARATLAEAGIETAVHYPFALSDHPAFGNARRSGGLVASATASQEVLSLPCYSHLTSAEERFVAGELGRVREAYGLE
jgi:dTDP-3-amino-3,4,6-trideoxy-alpha-D-glucose transaminase